MKRPALRPLRHPLNSGARLTTWLWLALLIALLQAPAALALEATVDRALVTEGDSLTLTIRVDGNNSDDNPDYAPLETDFHLFGSRQSSRSVISSGRAKAWTEWQITLVPKRSGQLTIPAITVGKARTVPILVDVQPAQTTTATGQQRDPVFIETTIDRDTVYVEQQLLLTVRVFHALSLDDMQLSDPEPEHARIEKVAQNSFRRDIDGVTYQVHELVYAIFAEQPGELVIPELVFSGRQPLRARSFFDFPGQGRALRRISRPLTIDIKPIPPQFSGTVWLPARNLTLMESWNGNPEQLAVGESMTRSLILQAEGVGGARLPELPQPAVDGGRLYADQPKLDDGGDARGLHGKRVQSAALIPARPGPLQLPGTKLVWWDVDSDSEKVAEIAPRQLQIRAAAPGTASATATPPPASAASINDVVGVPAIAVTDGGHLLGWQIATALLACGWAATLLWFWQRRKPAPTAVVVESGNRSASEPDSFRQLQRACREHQPVAARSALLAWGAALLNREQIGLDELLQCVGDDALSRAVVELEQQLYAAAATDAWRGEQLLSAVDRVRKQRRRENRDSAVSEALPPLYPSG